MRFPHRAALILLAVVGLFYAQASFAATTLLPNGKQCFSNANGPLVSGSVNMFIPSTTNPKATWQDSNQVTLNSQPIQLDAAGCAIIYGVGQYRQQVFTGPVVGGVTTGTLVWDQLTTDTSAFNSVFWAGLSGGTPNAITIVDTGFNATSGSQINFVALATNTGSATLNPSGFGAITIVKDTTGGSVVLTGGEIVAGNVISVVYYTTDNRFHLINTAIASASGNISPLCGANHLVITNSVGTPSTILTMTADSAVMVNASGINITRTSISLTSINISTGTVTAAANGMDGESPGVSQFLFIWMIDNGSTPAGLVSTSATTPTMPSGYTYKCRLGAMRVDGAGNLLRTLQKGARTQYTVVGGSNTANYPIITTGATGNPTAGPVFTTTSVTNFVPSTASEISFLMVTNNGISILNSNGNTGISGSTTNPSMFNLIAASASGYQMTGTFELESTNIFYAASVAASVLACTGWKDAVNAN